MNRNLLIILIVVVILVGGYAIFRANSATSPSTPLPTESVSPTSEETSPSQETGIDITISANGFQPQTVTIKAGERVTWTNNSGADVSINSAPHPAHTDYPPLNLNVVSDGQSVSLVFDNPGTYRYHNHLIPSQFGSITVE